MPDLKLSLDGFDVGKRRQSGLVAEALDLVCRGRARKFEMLVPGFARIIEIRKHVSAVKYVTCTVGIEHTLARDRQPGHGTKPPPLVVPAQPALAQLDAADPATPALEIIQHLLWCQVHLFAQPFGDDGDVDEFQK